MRNAHSIASVNATVFCSEAHRTEKTLTLILALHYIYFFFAFLCKSLSKSNLSSFWNKPIMNLEEKCIFRWGGRGGGNIY